MDGISNKNVCGKAYTQRDKYEIRDFTSTLLTEVCNDVRIKPDLRRNILVL